MELTAEEVVKELQTLLQDEETEALQIFLKLVRPEDIAEWLDVLSADDRQRLLKALDNTAAGTVLADTTAAIRSELVEDITPERLARIAEAMPPDEAADLIGELELVDSEQVLRHIADDDELVLRGLLKYPEDSAGGIMSPNVVALTASITAEGAINELRASDQDTVMAAVWVVDDEGVLSGVVRLRRLVTARPGALLGDIMEKDIISVRFDTDQEDVAELVDKYDFMAIPVVDADGRLLGAVTVDDVLDVIEEEATEDIYKMAGSFAEEEDSESVLHVARYRLPWLLVCLAGTQLSTFVLAVASRNVTQYQQLSVFTAAVMAMAGNTALQSATTTVRRLALGSLPRARFVQHVVREFTVAMLMGAVCGGVASLLALVLGDNPMVGVALGAAMGIGMATANLLGGAMPLILSLAKLDPAVASGPLVSTINDSLALTVYFIVATAILGVTAL